MREMVVADRDIEVVLLPDIGGRIHRLRAFGEDLIRFPAERSTHIDDPFFWGAYVMAPWCNRVDADDFTVAGQTLRLGTNFPDGTAIHGQVYARPWQVVSDNELRIRGGGDAWPWPYEVSQRITIDGMTVRIALTVTNESPKHMPAGIGIHPWFLRRLDVTIRADRVFPDNLATLPDPEPVSGPYDLSVHGPMPDDLDGTWADLGEPAVEMTWPDTGIRASMSVVSSTPYVVAASPSAIDAVAIEGQTHAPQGLRRLVNGEPGPMALLEPGESLSMDLVLTLSRGSLGVVEDRVSPLP